MRGLFQRGFAAKDVRELFRVIDWLMVLPPTLSIEFWQDVDNIQEENRMPFITTPERVGHDRGLRKGIAIALRLRFGQAGMNLMPEIENVYEEELEALSQAIETVPNFEEFHRILKATKS